MTGIPAAKEAGIPFLVAKKAPVPPKGAAGPDFPWKEYVLNRRATADLMIGMLMNLAYRITDSDRFCRESGYFQEGSMAFMGQGCAGKTVSIYGFGEVARQAARKLRP